MKSTSAALTRTQAVSPAFMLPPTASVTKDINLGQPGPVARAPSVVRPASRGRPRADGTIGPMAQIDLAYSATKAELITAIEGGGPLAWDTPVPATPAWRVRDVIAHVTGLAASGADGTTPGDLNLLEQFRDLNVVSMRNAFADGQVECRLDHPPAQIVAEWDAAVPMLLDRMQGDVPGVDPLPLAFDAVLVTDLCVHADDVLAAIGLSPDRSRAATGIAFATYAFGVDYRLRALGLPALGFRYDGKERTVGEGPPGATLTASRWELLRVVAGRRSRAQIAALEWTGDPERYLALLPAYGERTDDLVES